MKKLLVVESPTGRGAVIKGDKTIAIAQYFLVITQEIISDGRGGTIPGVEVITGRIVIVEGESNLADGSSLQLKMIDGRIWPFFAKSGNTVDKVFDCVGRGNFEGD